MSSVNRFKSSQYDKPFQIGSSVVVLSMLFLLSSLTIALFAFWTARPRIAVDGPSDCRARSTALATHFGYAL